MHEEKFHAFISYSTDPDYYLARQLEGFLESFHKKLKGLPDGQQMKPLKVCRDGSDFNTAKIEKDKHITPGDKEGLVRQVLVDYLERSEYLILLCSKNSALSSYVDFEVDWFLRNKEAGRILLAVTEGNEPENRPDLLIPASIRKAGINRAIYFDLRGWKKTDALGYTKVRNFEDSCVSLASHLYGCQRTFPSG